MIYRLKFRDGYSAGNTADKLEEFWDEIGFKAPNKKKINPKCRFFFTEYGWEVVGRRSYDFARKHIDIDIRVEKRKNPKRSAICYKDKLQIAILP